MESSRAENAVFELLEKQKVNHQIKRKEKKNCTFYNDENNPANNDKVKDGLEESAKVLSDSAISRCLSNSAYFNGE